MWKHVYIFIYIKLNYMMNVRSGGQTFFLVIDDSDYILT